MFASMDYPVNEMENMHITKNPTIMIFPSKDK